MLNKLSTITYNATYMCETLHNPEAGAITMPTEGNKGICSPIQSHMILQSTTKFDRTPEQVHLN